MVRMEAVPELSLAERRFPVPPPFICHALVMIDVETVEERAHSNLTFEKTQDSYQHFCDAPSNPVKRKMTMYFVFSMVLNRSKSGSVDAIDTMDEPPRWFRRLQTEPENLSRILPLPAAGSASLGSRHKHFQPKREM